jgi:mRNA interferase RelE/StbE
LAYKALIKKSALKDLQTVPKSNQKRLLDLIENYLSKDPYQGKALSGEFKGLYRWRSGKFRIIYEIQQELLVILVLRIGHRKDVYR